MEKSNLERITGQDLDFHQKHDHNVWNYMYFI
jgi:hypothetical protein